jgi:uncharacterized protein (TIGR02145 family)
MKKFTIIIFLVFGILKIQAQDYLISFAGTGDTSGVTAVIAENLTSGDTVILNGGDLLHLCKNAGINERDLNKGSVQIYPNPVTDQAILTFASSERGSAVIIISDLSGKTIYQTRSLLSPGLHSFQISGIREGIYIVKVASKNYDYSVKMISLSKMQGKAKIENIPPDRNIKDNQNKSTVSTIDMRYNTGDLMLYTGIAGQYSNVVTDIPTENKTITFHFVLCKDSDGNTYPTVEIGAGKSGVQVWMARNLNVGVRIWGGLSQTDNGIIEKYCYTDSANFCSVYGGWYQWFEMMQYTTTGGVQGICPAGWHLPTDAEWQMLVDYLVPDAGAKLKETGTAHWLASSFYSGNNTSGFTGLPGGGTRTNHDWWDMHIHGYFWTSTFTDSVNSIQATCRDLYFDNRNVAKLAPYRSNGLSVRCLKNN